jgi:homoserine/homoserine lactone efflux protein
MDFPLWLTFLATEIVLCLTPGPAVLFVVSQALRYGGRRSLWANGGILAGNLMYFGLSAIGIGALIASSYELFVILKYAGATYLIWLGILTILGRGAAIRPDIAAPEVPGIRLLARGFVLQAANPKALVFFTALLPQFVSPSAPIAPQIAILALTSPFAEFFVLATYGFFSGRAAAAASQPRFARVTNYAAGTLLVGAGVGLGFTTSAES